MSGKLLVSLLTGGILYVLVTLSTAEVKGPQTYGTCYQNITTDRAEEGFLQMYGMCINKTQFIMMADNRSFVAAGTLSMAGLGQAGSYNYTPTLSSAMLQADPVSRNSPQFSNFGIIVASLSPIHLISVKSDLGTSDAYYNFPQTNNSISFMILGWPRIQGRPFLTMIMAVPVLDGTCIELYKIFNGNIYNQVTSVIVGKFQLFRYFAAFETYIDSSGNLQQNQSVGEDVTAMFLNASKPVQCIFGAECGWVPTPSDLFCDYMADSMPPINQLGTSYVVPPIYGRSAAAGYIVRVVPSQDNTKVTYLNGQTKVVRLGDFLQFDQPSTVASTVVECDKPCAVAQYNKGYLDYNDVPTDPYMVTCVPSDRFTAGAPFGTANFCEAKDLLIDFDDWICVVTFDAYKNNILYDDSPISDQFSQGGGSGGWTTVQSKAGTMAVTCFSVQPGFHYLSMSAGNDGSFVCYVYGHSIDPDSSSGYGYFANFNSTGESVADTYKDNQKIAEEAEGSPDANVTCNSEAYLVGSIISSNVGQYAPFPFTLTAGISPGVPLSPSCLAAYHDQLLQLLQDFSRKINYWICVSQNCSFLGGQGVAINYATLNVTYQGTGGIYTSVQVYVEMIARLDVSAQNFAQCRAEIENYMYYFINWPPAYSPDLLHQVVGAGCPYPIPFQKAMFDSLPLACPTYDTIYND